MKNKAIHRLAVRVDTKLYAELKGHTDNISDFARTAIKEKLLRDTELAKQKTKRKTA